MHFCSAEKCLLLFLLMGKSLRLKKESIQKSMLTPGSLLFALLRFLSLGELVESFGCFLKFGDKVLNIIQDVVKDLLQREAI